MSKTRPQRKSGKPAQPSSFTPEKKERTAKITKLLKKAYPNAHCTLNYTNELELLLATILSAQCTDERVNIVTAGLFRKYRSCEDYLRLPREDLEKEIKSTGFFRNKARSIHGTCQTLIDKFHGKVPRTMDELLTLPGVARKTANVVLGNAFGIASGVVVDTHVTRLSQRLGLTEETDAQKIERDLVELVAKKDWVIFSHLLIHHGRAVCKAIRPLCGECLIEPLCPSSLLKAAPKKEITPTGAKPARKAGKRRGVPDKAKV